MSKILITGGGGYVGSMLSTALVNLGHEVTVIDVLKFSSKPLNHLFGKKNFHFIKGDVRQKKLIEKLVKKNEFIIPLAALVGAPLCEKNKKEANEVNLYSINHLMKIIKKKNKKVIYLTTNSGYGVGAKNKYCDEKSPLNPISLYGRTKVQAEKPNNDKYTLIRPKRESTNKDPSKAKNKAANKAKCFLSKSSMQSL